MSMISMSIPTFVMGCLPGYEVIGGWSTAGLIVCRLAQGVSVWFDSLLVLLHATIRVMPCLIDCSCLSSWISYIHYLTLVECGGTVACECCLHC